MKLVNANGGHSIGVYNSETNDKSKVFRMLEENRIKYFEPADYTEGSKLEILLKEIIDRTKANEVLEQVYYKCLDEKKVETGSQDEVTKEKAALIDKLEESTSFRNTHSIIKKLSRIRKWTETEKEQLLRIAIENSQVYSILKDNEIRQFYEKICDGQNNDAIKIAEIINKRS